MWVYSKPRNEHENRFLLNLDQSSRINLIQLGERWFIEVMVGSEAVPVASVTSLEEAAAILTQIFEGLKGDATALDLNAPTQERQGGQGAVDGRGRGTTQDAGRAPEPAAPAAGSETARS